MTKKRGPKPGQPRLNSVKTLAQIAEELGISLTQASYSYRTAMNKLRHIPGAFELILSTIHGVEADKKDILQANSVECNPAFVELFSDGGSKDD